MVRKLFPLISLVMISACGGVDHEKLQGYWISGDSQASRSATTEERKASLLVITSDRISFYSSITVSSPEVLDYSLDGDEIVFPNQNKNPLKVDALEDSELVLVGSERLSFSRITESRFQLLRTQSFDGQPIQTNPYQGCNGEFRTELEAPSKSSIKLFRDLRCELSFQDQSPQSCQYTISETGTVNVMVTENGFPMTGNISNDCSTLLLRATRWLEDFTYKRKSIF